MSSLGLSEMDEKYIKIGKIYHAAMTNKISIEELESYFIGCGILSSEELENLNNDSAEIEKLATGKSDSDFNKLVDDFAFTHMVDANGNVVLIKIEENKNV